MHIKDLDINKITFSENIKKDSMGTRIPLRYEGQKFAIELPMMFMPFGATDFYDKKKKEYDGKFSVAFSYGDKDTKPLIRMMYEKFSKLDEIIIKTVVKNSKEWFSSDKEKSRDFIEEIYKNRLVKASSDPDKYAPTFVAKLPRNDKTGEFYSIIRGSSDPDDIIDVNGGDDKPEVAIKQAIPKLSMGKGLVNMFSMWCGSTNVSVSRNINLLQIRKNSKNMSKYKFSTSDDEEEEEEVHQEDSDNEEGGNDDSEKEFLDDDDNEEEKKEKKEESDGEKEVSDEEEEEDIPEPPKPVKKAPVRRGKKPAKKNGLKEALGAL